MDTMQPMYVTAERKTSTGSVPFDVMFGDTSYITTGVTKGLVVKLLQNLV